MRLGVSAALVDHELIPGDVEVDDGAIAAVGLTPAARAGIALPGYIDLQVNGFGGVDFLNTDRDGYGRAAEALLSTGVTAFQPTLVSSPPERTLDAIAVAAQAMPALKPRLLGVHLEGPFISPRRKGAHDERWIIPPSLPMLERLCASGTVATVTVAPELPGARDLIRWLVGHHVLVSLGHTDADAAAAHAAYDLGACSVTHLHNAQRPFSSRDPGIAAVAMTRADVTVQLIADLVHLAAETVLLAFAAAPDRVAAVTDAIAAAPGLTGEFRLGDRTILVTDAARLLDGTLAGSVLSMDRAVRNLIEIGIPWQAAVRAASTVPARLIGRWDLGTLHPGTPADVVVVDDTFTPTATFVGGVELWRR